MCREAVLARGGGAHGRENVGMSNHISDEKSDPRKPKGSVPMAIKDGSGDPKAMARAAADGKPVNIPAHARLCDGETEEIRWCALMVWRLERSVVLSRQIRVTAFNSERRAF